MTEVTYHEHKPFHMVCIRGFVPILTYGETQKRDEQKRQTGKANQGSQRLFTVAKGADPTKKLGQLTSAS